MRLSPLRPLSRLPLTERRLEFNADHRGYQLGRLAVNLSGMTAPHREDDPPCGVGESM